MRKLSTGLMVTCGGSSKRARVKRYSPMLLTWRKLHERHQQSRKQCCLIQFVRCDVIARSMLSKDGLKKLQVMRTDQLKDKFVMTS